MRRKDFPEQIQNTYKNVERIYKVAKCEKCGESQFRIIKYVEEDDSNYNTVWIHCLNENCGNAIPIENMYSKSN